MKIREWFSKKINTNPAEILLAIIMVAVIEVGLKRYIYPNPCEDVVEFGKDLCWEVVKIESETGIEIAFNVMVAFAQDTTDLDTTTTYGDLMTRAKDSLDIVLAKDHKIMYPELY